MQLDVMIDEETHRIEIPALVLEEGEEFFGKMDTDMAKGWQMSRQWVEQPGELERCQIAADRLMAALSAGNQQMATLMAGYIVTRLPGVTAVRVDTGGDMLATEFERT